MDAAAFRAQFSGAIDQMFALFAQETVYAGEVRLAIGDGIAFANQQRNDGGGWLGDFDGTIVYRKADFPAAVPAVGSLVQVGPRVIKLLTVTGETDPIDPCVTYTYGPKTK